MHVLLLKLCAEELDVAAAAVDLLLVFDGELDDQILPLAAELVKLCREAVEFGVLAGLDTWDSILKGTKHDIQH